ncbi:MAG: VWA domain-containing protein [Oligoflexus sp.]
MNFYWPEALYLYLLLPFLVWLVWRGLKVYRRRLQQLLGSGLDSLAPPISRKKQLFQLLLLSMVLSAMIFALARPRWGFEEREVTRQGIDLMVAIDVSRSMKAQDLQPDRLSRARREIIDLLRVLKGDRIGLIPFAGVAFVQCPPTIDYDAVDLFLQHLSPDLIPVAGTAIGDAIRLATSSLTAAGTDSGKVLILITDGEDHESDPLNAAREAAKAGIAIYTIGIGALEGAPVPGEHGEFVRDESGQIVMSRLDDSLLRQIAELTGGEHIRASDQNIGLEDLYLSQIRSGMEAGDLYQSQERIWHERFFWFAALASVLLGLEFFLRDS